MVCKGGSRDGAPSPSLLFFFFFLIFYFFFFQIWLKNQIYFFFEVFTIFFYTLYKLRVHVKRHQNDPQTPRFLPPGPHSVTLDRFRNESAEACRVPCPGSKIQHVHTITELFSEKWSPVWACVAFAPLLCFFRPNGPPLSHLLWQANYSLELGSRTHDIHWRHKW